MSAPFRRSAWRLALRAWPSGSRDRHTVAMFCALEEGWARARGRGRTRAAWYVLSSAADLLQSGVAERIVQARRRRSGDGRARVAARGLLADIPFAVRGVARRPVVSLLIIATLGLSAGLGSTIDGLLRQSVYGPLPYPDAERLVVLHQVDPASPAGEMGFSLPEVRDYRQVRSLDWIGEYERYSITVLVDGRAERVAAGAVSHDYLTALGARAALGRLFQTADTDVSTDATIVLSYDYWTRVFAGSPDVLGRRVTLRFQVFSMPATVAGVAALSQAYPHDDDLYVLLPRLPGRRGAMGSDRLARGLQLLGRRAPLVTGEALAADLDATAARLALEYPSSARPGTRVFVRSLGDELTTRWRPVASILAAAAACILLLACANIAGLVLAGLHRREQELAVRRALGAGPIRLALQVAIETLILAVPATLAAVGLTLAIRGVLAAYAARYTTLAGDLPITPRLVAMALLVAIAIALAAGVTSAPTAFRPRTIVRGTGATSRVRSMLTVAQVALGFVLLVSAALLLRSFVSLTGVDQGFDSDRVLSLEIGMDWERYDERRTLQLFDRVLEQVRALPGVTSAAAALSLPMVDSDNVMSGTGRLADATAAATEAAADLRVVTPEYFATLGISVLAGRTFAAHDRDSGREAIVNAAFARRHTPGRPVDALLGTRIQFCVPMMGNFCEAPMQVVGVVADVRQYGLERDSPSEIYQPLHQSYTGAHMLVVKTAVDPESLVLPIVRVVREADPTLPAFAIQTLTEARERLLAGRRLNAGVIGVLALLALVVTVVGVVATVSVEVSRRTREVAVRMALGAEAPRLLASMVGQTLRKTALGIAIGAAGAAAAAGLMQQVLWGVAATDPWSYALAAATLSASAAVAALIPAARVVGIDPNIALRAE